MRGQRVKQRGSLNPCFSGSSYRRGLYIPMSIISMLVLILVLVEVPIGANLTPRYADVIKS